MGALLRTHKNIFHDEILNIQDFQGGQEGKTYISLSF